MRAATVDDLFAIVSDLRPRDAEELRATVPDMRPEAMVERYRSYVPDMQVADYRGEVAGLVGGTDVTNGAWRVYAFGRPAMDRVMKTMTAHCLTTLIPSILERGCEYATCESLASYARAHAWLERLGMRRGDTLRGVGLNGEDMVRFIGMRGDYVRT